MELKDLKIKYDFSSGVIKNNQMIAEVEALKTTQAFKSVVADVDGVIPTILRPNGISNLKNFILTDNPAYLEGRTLQGTVAQGAIAANGDYIIYIDPNKIQQDPTTSRVLSIGEIVTHEIGHSTKEGLAVTVRRMNGQAGNRLRRLLRMPTNMHWREKRASFLYRANIRRAQLDRALQTRSRRSSLARFLSVFSPERPS